jgi:hypothetical protein
VREWWRVMCLVMKYGFPLYFIVLPALAVYGALSPRASAEMLRLQEPGQTPVLIGYSYRSRSTLGGSTSIESHSYLLVPQVVSRPKVVTILQTDRLTPVREDSIGGFIQLLLGLIVSAVGTWWFWFRRNPGRPPNNSSKPTPLRGAA